MGLSSHKDGQEISVSKVVVRRPCGRRGQGTEDCVLQAHFRWSLCVWRLMNKRADREGNRWIWQGRSFRDGNGINYFQALTTSQHMKLVW